MSTGTAVVELQYGNSDSSLIGFQSCCGLQPKLSVTNLGKTDGSGNNWTYEENAFDVQLGRHNIKLSTLPLLLSPPAPQEETVFSVNNSESGYLSLPK